MLPILKQKKLLSIFIHVNGGLQLKAATDVYVYQDLQSVLEHGEVTSLKMDLILHQDESNLRETYKMTSLKSFHILMF